MIGMTALFTVSCEDTFEPYGDFTEEANLVCLLRCDTTFQAAVLTSSYATADSSHYNYDEFIRGATIRVWYSDGDSVKVFKEADASQSNDFGTDFPVVYYADGFQPEENSELYIEALLPNGKRLTSSSLSPPSIGINYNESDLVIPSNDRLNPVVQLIYQEREIYVQLKLNILYSQAGEEGIKRISVPLAYETFNGEEIPVFPKPGRVFKYTFLMENINRAMEEISEGDVTKSNYTIYKAEWEIASIDENLRAYYNTTTGSSDVITIRLQEANYSNIEGGYGVFGSITNSVRNIKLETEYIRSFGYINAYSN